MLRFASQFCGCKKSFRFAPGNQLRRFCSGQNYSYIEDGKMFIIQDFLKKLHQSAVFLNSIRSDSLDRILDTFRSNFFPIERRDMMLSEIQMIVQEEKKKYGHIYVRKLPGGQNINDASEINNIRQSIGIVLESIDKAGKGFLTGDLSTKILKWMETGVDILNNDIEDAISRGKVSNKRRNEMIEKFYDQLFKVAAENNFKLPLYGIPFPELENPRNLFKRQLILENESNELAVDNFMLTYEQMHKFGLAHNLSWSRSHIVKWFPVLCKAIRMEQEACMQPDLSDHRSIYASFILKLSPEKLAIISLSELMKMITQEVSSHDDESEAFSHYLVTKLLFKAIGKAINMQLAYQDKESSIEDQLKSEMMATGENPLSKIAAYRKGEILRKVASEEIIKGRTRSKQNQIPMEAQFRMGATLTYLVKETAKVKDPNGLTTNLLSFGYTKVKDKSQYISILKISEHFIIDFMRNIEKEDSLFIQMNRSLPMIYSPAPWSDSEIGGYYQKPTFVMRIQQSKIQEDAVKYADLSELYEVLNIIGSVPWRINCNVLNTIEKLWEMGGGVGEIPLRYYDYQDYIYEYQLNECSDYKQKKQLMRKLQDQRDIHSLRCDFNLKLSQARAFRNVGSIYFPHNIDFRGRVYPIAPHLNHLGADINRGLLEFAEGRPLGKKGLRWLKIHLSNCLGNDKLTMDGREKYAESIVEMVHRIANDPINNREWLDAEDCWQSLATIFDLHAALTSPNPEEYVSHLHIHMDGSCNGMQHYAALGRDYEGGVSVSLVNGDKPGDLYTHILEMVNKKIQEICLDHNNPDFEIASKLNGNVARKTIKQTVMTTVYGVTFIGARKQIAKQLKGKEYLDHSDEADVYAGSKFLTRLTLDSVANLFTQAHAIKAWLKTVANIVVSTGNPVGWVTPMNLPVVQHYRTFKQAELISTLVQTITVNQEDDENPVNKSKQQTAFPPNFIHSLDSTHLMYTAQRCSDE